MLVATKSTLNQLVDRTISRSLMEYDIVQVPTNEPPPLKLRRCISIPLCMQSDLELKIILTPILLDEGIYTIEWEYLTRGTNGWCSVISR